MSEESGFELDLSKDSAQLVVSGEQVRCIVVIDVTPFNEDQRETFCQRSMTALYRMGDKVLNRRNPSIN